MTLEERRRRARRLPTAQGRAPAARQMEQALTEISRPFARFAARVFREKEDRGLSFAEMARRVDWDASGMTNVLREQTSTIEGPTLRTLVRLAASVGCELELGLRRKRR